MKRVTNGDEVWKFKAFADAGYQLQVTVKHQADGVSTWSDSTVLSPITVVSPIQVNITTYGVLFQVTHDVDPATVVSIVSREALVPHYRSNKASHRFFLMTVELTLLPTMTPFSLSSSGGE